MSTSEDSTRSGQQFGVLPTWFDFNNYVKQNFRYLPTLHIKKKETISDSLNGFCCVLKKGSYVVCALYSKKCSAVLNFVKESFKSTAFSNQTRKERDYITLQIYLCARIVTKQLKIECHHLYFSVCIFMQSNKSVSCHRQQFLSLL